MKPSAIEDARYSQADYCQINLEEEIVFGYLKEIRDKLSSPGRLYDLGCGTGLISQKVAELGFQVRGVDFSPVAVAKAQQHGVDAYVANVDEGLPEPDHAYDVVLAGDILEHVFDPLAVISEI